MTLATWYACARDLFEAAREAAGDAERCGAELLALDSAPAISSPSFEARVRGTTDPDRIGRRVASTMDRKEQLERRIDADYDLIDAATFILYGRDGISDGLASIAPGWWADAIYHHYLSLRTWEQTAEIMGYSTRYLQRSVRAAFDLMDANGMTATVAGIGCAEG